MSHTVRAAGCGSLPRQISELLLPDGISGRPQALMYVRKPLLQDTLRMTKAGE